MALFSKNMASRKLPSHFSLWKIPQTLGPWSLKALEDIPELTQQKEHTRCLFSFFTNWDRPSALIRFIFRTTGNSNCRGHNFFPVAQPATYYAKKLYKLPLLSEFLSELRHFSLLVGAEMASRPEKRLLLEARLRGCGRISATSLNANTNSMTLAMTSAKRVGPPLRGRRAIHLQRWLCDSQQGTWKMGHVMATKEDELRGVKQTDKLGVALAIPR